MPDLSGTVALVTGAGRGIGLGCARQLALAGADLILNDRPGSNDLSAAVEAVRATGRRCFGIEADATTRAGCEMLLDEAKSRFPRIDVAVSNVACSTRASFLDIEPSQFERTVAGTLTAGFHLAQLVARDLVASGQGGKLLFISSVQAELPTAGTLAYGAAKAGLEQMMRTIAVELAPHRINVNAIAPGWIDTPGERAAFSDETIRREAGRLPWGRLGTPDEIGRAAAFLVSSDAEYITGTVLTIDGGFRFRQETAGRVIEPDEDRSSRH
jgi:glucose 1-dehydrogenase